jgi:SpoVK/Ycf46/Vps4 family AAA+-type ATPase
VAGEKARNTLSSQWGFNPQQGFRASTWALFLGPPGVGKTRSAEAVARACGLPVKVVGCTELIKRLLRTDKEEKSRRPGGGAGPGAGSVLVVRGCEDLFTDSSEEAISVIMQEATQLAGIVILLATIEKETSLASLASVPRVRRMLGRMNFALEFAAPDVQARERLWRVLLPKSAPVSAVNFSQLAKTYSDFVGANIRNALMSAATRAASRFRADERVISMADIKEAADKEQAKLRQHLHLSGYT